MSERRALWSTLEPDHIEVLDKNGQHIMTIRPARGVTLTPHDVEMMLIPDTEDENYCRGYAARQAEEEDND